MTYSPDCTLPSEIIEQLASEGFEALPELIRILINTAMQTALGGHGGILEQAKASVSSGLPVSFQMYCPLLR